MRLGTHPLESCVFAGRQDRRAVENGPGSAGDWDALDARDIARFEYGLTDDQPCAVTDSARRCDPASRPGRPREETQDLGRASVADRCARTEGEDSGSLVSEWRRGQVADQVHAAVDGPKACIGEAPVDLSTADASRKQLPASGGAMLEVRQAADDFIGGTRSDFATHKVVNPAAKSHAPASAPFHARGAPLVALSAPPNARAGHVDLGPRHTPVSATGGSTRPGP